MKKETIYCTWQLSAVQRRQQSPEMAAEGRQRSRGLTFSKLFFTTVCFQYYITFFLSQLFINTLEDPIVLYTPFVYRNSMHEYY
jgi:hypothetical protein